VRDGFRVAEDEPLVIALRRAYTDVTGRGLPLVGTRMVGDAAIFIKEGKVPRSTTARRSGRPRGPGSVAVSDLVRAAKVYVLTILDYVGQRDRPGLATPPRAERLRLSFPSPVRLSRLTRLSRVDGLPWIPASWTCAGLTCDHKRDGHEIMRYS